MKLPRMNSGPAPGRDAILAGKRYYRAPPCPKCGGTERYIDGSCRECRRRYAQAYKDERPGCLVCNGRALAGKIICGDRACREKAFRKAKGGREGSRP